MSELKNDLPEILSVDRIEGEYAVCVDENGSVTDIPLSECENVREGDIIFRGENGFFSKNQSETDIRREEMISKQNELWE